MIDVLLLHRCIFPWELTGSHSLLHILFFAIFSCVLEACPAAKSYWQTCTAKSTQVVSIVFRPSSTTKVTAPLLIANSQTSLKPSVWQRNTTCLRAVTRGKRGKDVETVTTYTFYGNGSVGRFSNNSLAWAKKRQSYSRGRRLWVWVVGKNRSMVVKLQESPYFYEIFQLLTNHLPHLHSQLKGGSTEHRITRKAFRHFTRFFFTFCSKIQQLV